MNLKRNDVRKPSHYPACEPGKCAGCDQQAEREAALATATK